ncbi:hypothetical protein CONPUDRAFT_30174, partial [Coniophora puteana RWD-64-598 SS2]
HGFPVKPSPETLSRFIVYMQAFVSPKTINSYLSGICNQLETLYPDVRSIRRSPMVTKTMRGSFRRFQTPASRKDPLTRANLVFACRTLNPASCFDDALFIAQLLVGFYALMRSGELVMPDRKELRDHNKLSLRRSVVLTPSTLSFTLPRHKADTSFEGDQILVKSVAPGPCPVVSFMHYIDWRDTMFRFRPHLWLRADGTPPTRSWFMSYIRRLFSSNIAGHSLRAGGATALAEDGVPFDQIQ